MRNLVWSSNSHVENRMVCRTKKKIYIYIGRKGNEKKEKEIEDMWSQCRKGRSLF